MFAADARKHTPGKNAEKENLSMRILVCDDDAAFAGQLAEKIEAIVKPQMPRSAVNCATDAAQLRALPLAKYDLAFLDIDMGPLNGVDLARRLHELRPDMLLIFVTNYVEYSLQGYEVQAFRYLLKAEMPQKLERYVQQALTAYRKTRDTVRIFCDGEDPNDWSVVTAAAPTSESLGASTAESKSSGDASTDLNTERSFAATHPLSPKQSCIKQF